MRRDWRDDSNLYGACQEDDAERKSTVTDSTSEGFQTSPDAGTGRLEAMMTIQEAAQSAILCQDACNLSGVLASFHNVVMNVLWPEAHRINKGTAFINSHPICTLFLDKLASLNRSQCLCSDSMKSYYSAYAEVERLARGETADVEKRKAFETGAA